MEAVPEGAPGMSKQVHRHEMQKLTLETNTRFGVSDLHFELDELLGEGSFGAVYRCHRVVLGEEGAPPDSSQEFAVKVMDAQRLSILTGHPVGLICPRLRREVDILFPLGEEHAGVLRLHHAFFSPATSKFYLVTELLRGGDLFHAIVNRGQPFSEQEARHIFAQIIDTTTFCHNMGVAHRDLKLENCLLVDKESFQVKVCDFGQAKILRGEGIADTAQTLTTTPQYTAPEVASACRAMVTYDAFKADSFGLGVMLYALLFCSFPDTSRGGYDRHWRWSSLSVEAQGLIKALLNPDAEVRPLPQDVQRHPWLAPQDPEAQAAGADALAPAACAAGERPRLLTDAVLAVQEVISALQRERGTMCWALGGAEGEQRLEWQMKCVDERQDEAVKSAGRLSAGGGTDASAWAELSAVFCSCRKELAKIRKEVQSRIKEREEVVDLEETMSELLGFYTALLERISGSFTGVLAQLSFGQDSLAGYRLRYFQMAGEQLSRERALITWHLVRSERIRNARIFRELAEIIGSRKLLLGSVQPGSHLVTMSSVASALGLMETPILDASELAALEAVEDRAMSGKKLEMPAVAEWWHHLTKAIDKVHQHFMVCFVEHMNP